KPEYCFIRSHGFEHADGGMAMKFSTRRIESRTGDIVLCPAPSHHFMSSLLALLTLMLLGILSPAQADDSLLHKAAAQHRHAYHTGYITSLIRFEHNTELRYIDTP